MRNTILILLLFLLNFYSLLSQTMKQADDDQPLINITSDMKVTTSQNTTAKNASATGNLGISFMHKWWYGSTLFTVINRNLELKTSDTSETEVFINNLLIPENSGQGLSSFQFGIGRKSFTNYSQNKDWVNSRLIDRIGFFVSLQVNNTVWTKDTVSADISIFSPSAYLTLNVLDFTLDNKDEDKVYLSLFGGYQGRMLGGDYGLAGNTKQREYFLNLDKDVTDFTLTTFGAKLELGKFYGKFQGSYTWGKYDLKGFSGWQALITLGTNIDFNLKTKPNSSKKDKKESADK